MAAQRSGGPFFEQLEVGDRFSGAPGLTLTEGLAAQHQAIVGDRLPLALDRPLAARVLGGDAALAHPALVCDVAIGQSTLVTQRVVANLFYRGLVFHRAPRIGDTLRTVTTVAALRQNRPRPGRAATGMAVLRIRTVDQHGQPVLDFSRCAMLPLQDPDGVTGRADDLGATPATFDPAALSAATSGWDLDAYRDATPGPHAADLAAGMRWTIGADVVSSAPELARLSLNIATAHHDASAAGGRRLVYGGHTIGLAAAQATRALPSLVTIVAWHGCDHLAPVHEGDTLASELELERLDPQPAGGALAHLCSRATVSDGTDVLDWRFVALLA